jgi:hypothetical protein
LRRFATWAALGSVLVAGTVFAQSFLEAPPLQAVWFGVWFATFPLVFFAWGVTILVLNAMKATGFAASLGRTVPWWSLAWRVLVGGALIAVFTLSNPGPSNAPAGQPVEVDGRYYVNNHGTKTEISKDEYVTISASWARGFAAAEMFFAGAAVLVLSGPWARKDAHDENPSGA